MQFVQKEFHHTEKLYYPKINKICFGLEKSISLKKNLPRGLIEISVFDQIFVVLQIYFSLFFFRFSNFLNTFF